MRSFIIGVGLVLSWLVFPVKAAVMPDSAASKVKPLRFVFNFDTRHSLVGNDRVRIGGIKTGVEWKRQFRAGLGYYAFTSPLIWKLQISPDQNIAEKQLKLQYGAVYGEWVLLRNQNWEISFPLQLGFGKTQTSFFDGKQNLVYASKSALWLAEPTLAGHYKVFPWVGVGVGAGYRQILNQRKATTSSLNAPIYYLKAKIFVGEIYRQFRQKRKSVPA